MNKQLMAITTLPVKSWIAPIRGVNMAAPMTEVAITPEATLE